MTDGSPIIKVLVACHKPTACPESNLYLPVQLGAVSATPIAGMQPDSEGENISERNFSFCELSAQYWGWKNLEADYVGLCHYRRYFCFDGIDHPKNDHAQIEIPCLSPASAAQYRLDDEELARSVIAQHDMIIPERWDVRMVPTPLGPQPTIRRHMIAYGLMTNDTLNKLVELCAERQPDYAPLLEAYLEGHAYQGYNCFVMKRDLFDRFCAFEFDLLQAFDEWFDYTDITTTKRRIAGYLGEILVSVFTLKVEAEGERSIAQFPLTFFEDTPPLAKLETSLIWNFPYGSPSLLAVCLRSLAKSLGGKALDVSLIVPTGFDREQVLRLAGDTLENLAITWVTWPTIELYPLLGDKLAEADAACILPLALPWLMPNCMEAQWVEGVVLFEDGPLPAANGGMLANQDIHLQRELNKPALAKAKLLCDDRGRHPHVLGSHYLAMSFETLRKSLSLDDVVALYLHVKRGTTDALKTVNKEVDPRLEQAIIRADMLGALGFEALPFSDVSLGLDTVDTKTWANEVTAHEWLDVKTPTITVFGCDDLPDAQRRIQHADRFWHEVRESTAYEAYLQECLQPKIDASLQGKLLPEGSRRRALVRSVVNAVRSRTSINPL